MILTAQAGGLSMLNECFSINAILMFRSFPDWVFVKVA
jgi:hypothetical protein